MDKNSKKNRGRIGVAVIATLVCAAIGFIVFLLTAEKRTEVTASEQTQSVSSLVCEKSGIDNEYFNIEKKVTGGKHELRANFDGDRLVDLMYSYRAAYDDGTDLEYVKNVAEANFNLAYGNKYEYKDNLWSASFTVDKNAKQVKMNVYAGANSLSSDVAAVFQLDKDKSFPKTLNSMKSAYETKGFSCILSQK